MDFKVWVIAICTPIRGPTIFEETETLITAEETSSKDSQDSDIGEEDQDKTTDNEYEYQEVEEPNDTNPL